MTLIRDFTREARGAGCPEDLYRIALRLAGRRGGWDVGRVHGVDGPPPLEVRATELLWCDGASPPDEASGPAEPYAPPLERRTATRAFESGAPVWIEDAEAAPPEELARREGRGRDGGAVLAVPVTADASLRAVLSFRSAEPLPRDEAFLREVQDLAVHLGCAVEQRRAATELARSHDRLEGVLEATQAIDAAGVDPDDVMQVTAERVQPLVGATSAVVLVPSGDVLVVKGASGNAENTRDLEIPLDDSLSGMAFRSGEIKRSRDTRMDPRINWDAVRDTTLRSMVLVPLVDDDERPVALLNVMSADPDAFGPDDVNILRLLSGQMGGALGRARAFRDNRRLVEKLTRTTHSLEDTLERVQAILDASPHPIVALDHRGRVRLWSRAAEHLYGWSEDEARGRFPPMIPEEHVEDVRRRIARVQEGETIHHVDLSHVRRHGGTVDVRVSLAPIRRAQDEAPGVLAVVTDVTELRTVETRLQHAERMEAIGRLAAGVAHDFNNLLTTIRGHADLLLTAGELVEEDRESVQEILEAVDRSAAITHQLLAYSRRQHLEPRPLDLSDVVREMAGLLRRLLGERVELILELAPVGGPVMADRSQIDQVVMNLVVNARDALPEGGEVRISTRLLELDDRRAARLGDLEPGPYLRLSVSDDGMGIPPEAQRRIFEPFFSTKGPTKGTGMGLATVDGIIHQSGGAVRVESEVGEGAAFHVYLPVARDVVEAAEDGETTPECPVVLLVEETESVERLVRRILEPRGYLVLSTDTPEKAVQHLESGGPRPSLLLADESRQTSRDFVGRIREVLPDLPVVLLSDDPPREPASDQHRTVQVLKPFSPDMLEDVVARLLRS